MIPPPGILPEYFQAYVAYVCPLRRPPPSRCIQTMRVPPLVAQRDHLQRAAAVPDGLRGLVLDVLSRGDEEAAAFAEDAAFVYEQLQKLFAQSRTVSDPPKDDDAPQKIFCSMKKHEDAIRRRERGA